MNGQISSHHVMAIIIDKGFRRKVLVKNAGYNGKPPGYGFAGGHANQGEDLIKALMREVSGETDLKIEILDKVCKIEKISEKTG